MNDRFLLTIMHFHYHNTYFAKVKPVSITIEFLKLFGLFVIITSIQLGLFGFLQQAFSLIKIFQS